jgi:hypothetical protein
MQDSTNIPNSCELAPTSGNILLAGIVEGLLYFLREKISAKYQGKRHK